MNNSTQKNVEEYFRLKNNNKKNAKIQSQSC